MRQETVGIERLGVRPPCGIPVGAMQVGQHPFPPCKPSPLPFERGLHDPGDRWKKGIEAPDFLSEGFEFGVVSVPNPQSPLRMEMEGMGRERDVTRNGDERPGQIDQFDRRGPHGQQGAIDVTPS